MVARFVDGRWVKHDEAHDESVARVIHNLLPSHLTNVEVHQGTVEHPMTDPWPSLEVSQNGGDLIAG